MIINGHAFWNFIVVSVNTDEEKSSARLLSSETKSFVMENWLSIRQHKKAEISQKGWGTAEGPTS